MSVSYRGSFLYQKSLISIGGFLENDTGSQGPTSPSKIKANAQSLVPVTIKEVFELQASMNGEGFAIRTDDNSVSLEIGNVL